jgi:hypothetical protein
MPVAVRLVQIFTGDVTDLLVQGPSWLSPSFGSGGNGVSLSLIGIGMWRESGSVCGTSLMYTRSDMERSVRPRAFDRVKCGMPHLAR